MMFVLRLFTLICALLFSVTVQAQDSSFYDVLTDEALLARADNNDKVAQWHYAMKLLRDDSTQTDEARAFSYIKRSAEAGYPNAIISLAVMYATGEGTEKSLPRAFETYEKAARLNMGHAFRGLGGMFCSGEGPSLSADMTYTSRDLCAAYLSIGILLNDSGSADLIMSNFDVETSDDFRALLTTHEALIARVIQKYGATLPEFE